MLAGRAAIPLAPLCALIAACSDGPVSPGATTPVRLCTDAPFVAVLNTGEPWTRVYGENGEFRIDATDRVGLAFAWGDRTIPYLVVKYMSAEQATSAHPCTVTPVTPPLTIAGVVKPWDGRGQVQMSYGRRSYMHAGPDSTFSLREADRPSDLVAVRGAWSNRQYAERVLLRRAQSYTAASRVVLDLAGDDSFAPEPGRLRFTGPVSGVEVTFRSASGEEVMLDGIALGEQGDPELPRDTTMATVPAARMIAGDLHRLRLHDFSGNGTARQVALWTRVPKDVTMRFGPPAAMPAFRTVASSPAVRVTAEIPSQSDYGASVLLHYDQRTPARSIQISATREYFGGTPATWTIEMPDLAHIEGYPLNTALEPGPFGWSLHVTGRPGFYWVPIPPAEGQLFRAADRYGGQPYWERCR